MKVLVSLSLFLLPAFGRPSHAPRDTTSTRMAAAGYKPVELSLEPLAALPEPVMRPNANASNGLESYYRIYDSQTGDLQEEFSIHIIDGGFSTDDNSTQRLRSRGPTDVSLAPRANWVCDYVVGCFDTAVKQFSISSAQISAASTNLANDLRADGYAKAKKIIGGVIYEHAIGISTNIISFYITNKMQGQDTGATDSCSSLQVDKLENMIAQMQVDLKDLGDKIQAADSRARTYDHYSFETTRQLEGGHLKHTIKPTTDPNDYKDIGACDS